jgi:hypothetical protein
MAPITRTNLLSEFHRIHPNPAAAGLKVQLITHSVLLPFSAYGGITTPEVYPPWRADKPRQRRTCSSHPLYRWQFTRPIQDHPPDEFGRTLLVM